jgi:hypothetical protein
LVDQQNSLHSMLNMPPFPDYPANICTSINGQLGLKSMGNKNWGRTDEFLKLLDASMALPTPDVNLMRAVTDYLLEEALVIPISGSGRGAAMYPYVMDGGWYKRSLATMWKPEQVG